MSRSHVVGFILLAVVAGAEQVRAEPPTYEIDPAHTNAQFSVRHMMVANVHGQLGKVTGTVRYDKADLKTASVDVSIDVAGLDTHDPKRDAHLKSPDFFDVTKFPTVTFKSKRVEGTAGKLKLVGDLTLHGVTKEVVLDVEGPTPEIKDPRGNLKVGATATGKISRKDFGLKWNVPLEAGGVLVGDEVSLTIEVELGKKAAPVAGK
jgi:polyisoprenoid-binding protein YceI